MYGRHSNADSALEQTVATSDNVNNHLEQSPILCWTEF